MDYIAIILAIVFLLLTISKLKDKVFRKDNHFAQMQNYLDECKRINEELKTYDEIMKYKSYR